MSDLTIFFKEMIDVERDYARRLRETSKHARNTAVKALINAIAMDSEKHSMIYRALAEGLSNVEQLTVAETEALLGEINYHLQTEAEFIQQIKSIMKNCRDETVKFILNTILKDETYHHQLLLHLREFVEGKRKKLDEALWKILWGEVTKRI